MLLVCVCIHLLALLHGLLEHLDALDLLLQSQPSELNSVIHASLALEDSACQDSALALDGKAVVDGKQEGALHNTRL